MKDKGRRALPKLDVNITNDCNLRCSHCCFRSGEVDLGRLSLVNLAKLFSDFKFLGGKRIDITGGEPLMHPEIDFILEYAIEHFGFRTELVTNSLLLTDERLEHFGAIGLSEIAISLDGSTHETHARIRGISQKAFGRVLTNIGKAAKLGIKTKVNTVVFASNFHDLADITRLAIDLGAREHGFYFFSPIGRGSNDWENVANPLDWLKLIRDRLTALTDKIKISLEVPILEGDLAEKLETRCYLEDPWHLQILPDGNVYPCAIMAAYNRPLGNLGAVRLRRTWGSEALWNGKYYSQNVAPLVRNFAGCVDYPAFSRLVRSGEYRFVCLCRKFSPQEVAR